MKLKLIFIYIYVHVYLKLLIWLKKLTKVCQREVVVHLEHHGKMVTKSYMQTHQLINSLHLDAKFVVFI